LLPVDSPTVHVPAHAIRVVVATKVTATMTTVRRIAFGQLVQESVAGLVLAVAAPPDAATPVSDGMEK
jgi:hypothetical protein